MGFLNWLWKRKKSEPPPDEAIEEMRRCIDRDVAIGFVPIGQIIDAAVDILSDEYRRATLQPIAERLTDEAIKSHVRKQKEWPTATDCDRLDEAFAELEHSGVVARQHFSCCGT